jgi:hypothetical protein
MMWLKIGSYNRSCSAFAPGVQQFMFILPLMGVFDVYLGTRFDEDSAQKKFSGIVATQLRQQSVATANGANIS